MRRYKYTLVLLALTAALIVALALLSVTVYDYALLVKELHVLQQAYAEQQLSIASTDTMLNAVIEEQIRHADALDYHSIPMVN